MNFVKKIFNKKLLEEVSKILWIVSFSAICLVSGFIFSYIPVYAYIEFGWAIPFCVAFGVVQASFEFLVLLALWRYATW